MTDKIKYKIKWGKHSYIESLGIGLVMPILAVLLTGIFLICIFLIICFCLACIPLGILGLLHIEKENESKTN